MVVTEIRVKQLIVAGKNAKLRPFSGVKLKLV